MTPTTSRFPIWTQLVSLWTPNLVAAFTHLDSCLGNWVAEEVLDVVVLIASLCVHAQSDLSFEVSVDADFGLGDGKLNYKAKSKTSSQLRKKITKWNETNE
jgi:hypothetical protein